MIDPEDFIFNLYEQLTKLKYGECVNIKYLSFNNKTTNYITHMFYETNKLINQQSLDMARNEFYVRTTLVGYDIKEDNNIPDNIIRVVVDDTTTKLMYNIFSTNYIIFIDYNYIEDTFI